MNLDSIINTGFLALAAVLLLLERIPSLHRRPNSIGPRWITNIGLSLLSGGITGLLFPETLSDVALGLAGGILPYLQIPTFAEVVLVFFILDFWRYWEHRVLHEVPLMWRMHLVHHSDTAVDVTTSVRHHPFESIFTISLSFMLVFALGVSAQAIGIYLLIALLASLYTHTNLKFPETVDRQLRRILVTPAVHAVHHSDYQPETDSNYGSVLTIWDRLFDTYTSPATATIPHFGLEYFRGTGDSALGPVLLQPFEYHRGSYPDYPAPQATADKPAAPTLTPDWQRALRVGAIGLAIVLIIMSPTVIHLASVWTQSQSYQYAWMVVPVFIYIVAFHRRECTMALRPQPGYSGSGVAVTLLSFVFWGAAFAADFSLGQHLALVLAIQGVALCALGSTTYRALLPALLFLFLMVPGGDLLIPILQPLTIKWLQWFAQLAGLPYQIDGHLVTIGQQRYAVIEACAGLTAFTLAGFLGYSFGLLLYRSFYKVVALAAIGAALGVLSNAARVCFIVGVDALNQSHMDATAHQDVQLLALLALLAVMLVLASRLEHEAEGKPASLA